MKKCANLEKIIAVNKKEDRLAEEVEALKKVIDGLQKRLDTMAINDAKK